MVNILGVSNISSALRAARIGSTVPWFYAIFSAYLILLMTFGPPVEGASENPSIRMFGLVMVSLFFLLCVFWGLRIFSGKGWLSCTFMILFSVLMIVGALSEGQFTKGFIVMTVGVAVLIIFGLRGTLAFRKHTKNPDISSFD